MNLVELQQAIDIESGQTDVVEEYEIDEQKILEATAGLIVVDLDQNISFHHLTVREYLERTGKRWFADPQVEIVTALLTYLNYKEFVKPCLVTTLGVDLKNVCKNTHYIYMHLSIGETMSAISTAIRVPRFAATADKERLVATIQVDYASWDVIADVNGLHRYGRFGLAALIPDLLQRGFEVDNSDIKFKQTALIYACRWGNEQTVTELLQAKINVNHCSIRGTTALFKAIEHENANIVDILQEAGVASMRHIL